MKKTFSGLIALMLLMNITITASATSAPDAIVEFDQNEKLIYELTNKDVFTEMISGETRTQTITVTNKNSRTADFYINLGDVVGLEDDSVTSGAYTVNLSVDDYVLFDSELGGMQNFETRTTTVSGLEELSDSVLSDSNVFIASLDNGQSVDLVVELGLDGESIRNGYANKDGSLQFNFSVNYKEDVRITEVEKVVVIKTEPIVNVVAVNTGDDTNIIPLLFLIVIGSVVIFLTTLKGKRRS